MQRRTTRRSRRLLIGLMVFATASIATLDWDRSAESAQASESPPARIAMLRLLPEWNPALVSPPSATFVVAPAADSSLFDPNPTYRLASVTSNPVRPGVPEDVVGSIDPLTTNAIAARAPPDPARPPAAVARLPERSATRPPHAANRSDRLFNDAQLASIKARLKLTASQERYWPAVEAALRALVWRGPRDGANHNLRNGPDARSLDPDGEAVQRLKSAAIPLVMTLRAEQKDEVRMLARVMGLERLAMQF